MFYANWRTQKLSKDMQRIQKMHGLAPNLSHGQSYSRTKQSIDNPWIPKEMGGGVQDLAVAPSHGQCRKAIHNEWRNMQLREDVIAWQSSGAIALRLGFRKIKLLIFWGGAAQPRITYLLRVVPTQAFELLDFVGLGQLHQMNMTSYSQRISKECGCWMPK